MNSFWSKISQPIVALAPMEDVTDTVFREVILSVSSSDKLGVLYTEFCSTDGLCHPVGKKKVAHRLRVNESEKALLKEKGVKLVAQIWGTHPEKFSEATKFITQNYDFDGIDINMGCPVKKIVKQGACSALIGQPELAKEIIKATQESTHLPVSVKTRTGVKQHNTHEWLSHVFSCNPSAVILHCRNQYDQSERPADWTQMKIAVELRDSLGLTFPLIGNGDIFTMQDANNFISTTKANGVMFGRGIFQNPWLFSTLETEPIPEEKIALLWKHAQLFDKTWANNKNFAILKRFFKIYAHNFTNAANLKAKLMETNSIKEVEMALKLNGFTNLNG